MNEHSQNDNSTALAHSISDERQFLGLISNDDMMMRILQTVAQLNLPMWCICAGFVKNKVWDYLHGYHTATAPSDIDVMFYETGNNLAADQALQALQELLPQLRWDVANMAYAHEENDDQPYASLEDALSKLPETATAVGVRLDGDELKVIAPLGIEDLLAGIIRPTPIFYKFPSRKCIIVSRLTSKHILEKWPLLTVVI